MGCAVCKVGGNSVRERPGPTLSNSDANPKHIVRAGHRNPDDAQGSATTLGVSSTSPISRGVDNAGGAVSQSKDESTIPIRRVAPTALEDDEIAGKTSQVHGGPDINHHKAPSYRVRKSIVTARVRLGSTNRIYAKYEMVDEILGTGISGAVRVAVDRASGRRYAIKTLSLENITAKKAAMLHNEVDIYLKLDHPNIAKLIEVYEDERRIFLTAGRELYDRLAARKRYHEADAARVTQQMLEAINYCHKHRICHRDLKLENWVYASEGEDAQLKLIDFGFSRIFNPVIPMTAMHGTVYYVSPEVMDGCYREKCDIWSIGVIVFMLLSGIPPFNGSVDYQILLKIRNAAYTFDAPIWGTVSQDAKDFITSLLVRDPNQRPSAEEALQHKWLKTALDDDSNEIDVAVLHAIRSFALGNTMKRAALGLVAYSFTNDEVQYLYKEFKKLDRDKKGTIRLQDLAEALTEHLKISAKEASRVFEKIDQTGDREVHYTEFVAATLHAKMLTDGNWVRDAFNRLDVGGTGRITVEDLRAVLGDSFNGTSVEEIMRLCDVSGTGELDFDDFREVLTSPEGDALLGSGDALETRASFSSAVVSIQLGASNSVDDASNLK